MRKSLLSLLLLCVFVSHAQKENAKNKVVSIGFVFSPDYSYRSLSNRGANDLVIAARNDAEKPKLGFTTGFTVLYSFQKHLVLETGLLYANKGYRTKTIALTYAQSGQFEPTKGHLVYSLIYSDVPVNVLVLAGDNGLRFFASAGITTSFYLQERATLYKELTDGSNEKSVSSVKGEHNGVLFSPMFGLGMEKTLAQQLRLRIEPVYRYGLTPVNNMPAATKLWSAGLIVGVFYSLK